MLYLRFLLCLAFGLTGACMVLTRLLDTLFSDWDAAAYLRYSLVWPLADPAAEPSAAFEPARELSTRLSRSQRPDALAETLDQGLA